MIQRNLEREKRKRNLIYGGMGVFLAGVDAFAGYVTYQAITARHDLLQAVIPVDVVLGGIDIAMVASYLYYMPKISFIDRVFGFGSEHTPMRRELSRGYRHGDRANLN